MRKLISLLALVAVTGCSSEHDAEPAPSFDESPYRYCMERDPGWMKALLARINNAAPFGAGSALYERLNVQRAIVDGILQDELQELQLRFTLEGSDGERVNLAAYGVIDPTTCGVREMKVFEGVRPVPEPDPLFVAV